MSARKMEATLISAVTIGSILEWYEIYLYVYWSPIIADEFFDLSGPVAELINALLVLIVGFIARPLGGLIFGYIGDRWGRKRSFLLSIILISIPSFATAFMSFSTWNLFAIVYVGIMKFIQGIPAGGELPGALCLLSEGSSPERKRYLCSYALVGPLIGQIISMTQCIFLEMYLSHESLVEWGWRISFFIGGTIGIFGYFLRTKIHESDSFKHLKKSHHVSEHPIKEAFTNHKKNILLGFLISIFEVVGFFMIAFFLVDNFTKIFNIDQKHTLLINIIMLTPLTVIQPLIGKLGDKYRNKPLYILSAVGVIFISIPFYFAIRESSQFWSITLLAVLVLFLSIQFALLPSLIVDLYPTEVRFTCIGFSFNVCDSVIGGMVPLLATLLVQGWGNTASFVIIYPIAAMIFLCTLPFIELDSSKEEAHHSQSIF